MRPELIVAEKEFRDHVTSKRFIVIFGILMLLAIWAISTGMDSYNQKLDVYKNPEHAPDYMYKQPTIDMYQKMIQEAQANNQSPESIQLLQDQLDRLRNPAMPSVLDVFQGMVLLFTFVGMVLGASLGFDQIAREKDEGSLKFLVSSPIYRDAIINGKTIGAIGTLAGAMGAALAIAIAIMMLKGVVPNLDDLIRIFLFFVAALLYCTVFFALAMMVSALSRNTAIAAIMTVGMIFVVFIVTVLIALLSNMIAENIVGPAPVNVYNQYTPVTMNASVDNNITHSSQPYEETESYKYYNRLGRMRADVSNILSTFSPIDDFSGYLGYGHMGIGTAMITRQNTFSYMYGPVSGTANSGAEMSLLDSLLSVWMKVLALIVEIVAAFGIAYVAFMRTDVR
jgi:ABC-2 type transport system permease protein